MDGKNQIEFTGPREVVQGEDRTLVAKRTWAGHDIFDDASSKLVQLKKAKVSDDPARRQETSSNLSSYQDELPPLIDKLTARDLRDFNATHSICLDAKRASSVGLGHREMRIHEVLDPLCRFSWQDVLNAVADDYFETGEGFVEVVWAERDGQRVIAGLYHMESARVTVVLEEQDNSEQYHYKVQGDNDAGISMMAKWGDLDNLKQRFGDLSVEGSDEQQNALERQLIPANDTAVRASIAYGEIVDSELIHWRQATNRSRYLGYPDYMAAVPSIELVQCMTQYKYDFYFNRGVPEFILFLIGKNLGDCWPKVTDMIEGSQGPGNSHKTGAINIPADPEDIVVQLERLAMDGGADDGYAEESNVMDMRICTAHGMPPQLANIALPGKMGAANETPNAMLTFQQRKLGQAQKSLSGLLAGTLGDQDTRLAQPTGGPVQLSRDEFLATDANPLSDANMPQFVQRGNGFNTILDGMTLAAQQTMASMREPMGATDRNPDDGLLGGARDRQAGDRRQTRGAGTGQ